MNEKKVGSGARNPKEVRMSFGITESVNARLEHLCDVAGMNKGAMAAAVLAAGLQQLESVILGINPAAMVAAARQYEQLQRRDLEEAQRLTHIEPQKDEVITG